MARPDASFHYRRPLGRSKALRIRNVRYPFLSPGRILFRVLFLKSCAKSFFINAVFDDREARSGIAVLTDWVAEFFCYGYSLRMGKELWTAVDAYMTENLIPSDPVLEAALQSNAAAGFPTHDVAPNQGKFLNLLARMQGAKRILEIGTLGGYSTIWLARALPKGGIVVTLEAEPKHAEVAAANIQRAGLASCVEIRLGPALDSLAQLHEEGEPPFDLIFIDADKKNNPGYLEWSLRLSRAGTVIIADNVIREGSVIDPQSPEPHIHGVRRFVEMIAADGRLDAVALQMVGGKGYDGFILAIVNDSL